MWLTALLALAVLLRVAVVVRRRRARRRLEQHWRDVTEVFREETGYRVDVTLPVALLALLMTGSALAGALVLLVATVAAGRRGLTVDERELLTAAQPTTEDTP